MRHVQSLSIRFKSLYFWQPRFSILMARSENYPDNEPLKDLDDDESQTSFSVKQSRRKRSKKRSSEASPPFIHSSGQEPDDEETHAFLQLGEKSESDDRQQHCSKGISADQSFELVPGISSTEGSQDQHRAEGDIEYASLLTFYSQYDLQDMA